MSTSSFFVLFSSRAAKFHFFHFLISPTIKANQTQINAIGLKPKKKKKSVHQSKLCTKNKTHFEFQYDHIGFYANLKMMMILRSSLLPPLLLLLISVSAEERFLLPFFLLLFSSSLLSQAKNLSSHLITSFLSFRFSLLLTMPNSFFFIPFSSKPLLFLPLLFLSLSFGSFSISKSLFIFLFDPPLIYDRKPFLGFFYGSSFCSQSSFSPLHFWYLSYLSF